MSYICKTPVVMIIFNRPQFTRKVFDEIRKVKPAKLYVISDGSRDNNSDDISNVEICREIVNEVDWTCDVIRIYSDSNLGCKKRVISGLNEVFSKEERAIILEDDCVPTEAFFEFCDWGLDRYENNNQVAIVSGSNLLDYVSDLALNEGDRAGFSMYINCWGWATWKRTWNEFDPYLSVQEINSKRIFLFKNTTLGKTERLFWTNVFKHSVSTRTIWDFYLQYTFFENSFVSIYPKYNLVRNIGFGNDSTHTFNIPKFVEHSLPNVTKFAEIMRLHEPESIIVNDARDKQVIRIVYGYSKLATIKLVLGNNLRYNGII